MAEPANFFSRWSHRKANVAKGTAVPEVAAVTPASGAGDARALSAPQTQQVVASKAASQTVQDAVLEADSPTITPEAAPLTLDDVKALTAESDFSAFTAKSVTPEVRNAAMKKLFTDPYYNIMDGLDIYIDDYSKPDPIPESMLRQMVGAQFLNLFDTEQSQQNDLLTNAAPGDETLKLPHDHADLRLQPDHAAGGPQDLGNAEPGTERALNPAQRPVPP